MRLLLAAIAQCGAISAAGKLRAVLRAHPHASLLISSNLGDANFSQSPLGADASALELEEPTPYVGDTSSGGLNIGIVFFHRRAAPQLEALLAQWVALLTTRRRDGRLALASFDQGLINQALRRHARRHAADPALLAVAMPTPPSGGRGGQGRAGGCLRLRREHGRRDGARTSYSGLCCRRRASCHRGAHPAP